MLINFIQRDYSSYSNLCVFVYLIGAFCTHAIISDDCGGSYYILWVIIVCIYVQSRPVLWS